MKNISIFQFAPKWLDISHNLSQVSLICRRISGTSDLLVLPEMFNSGYVLDAHLLSEQWQVETLSVLKSLASSHHLAIGGSIPFFEDDHWYNRFIFVESNGNIQFYDKIQLFAPAGEKKVYHAGDTIKDFSFMGWKIQPLICYDLRFPYLSFSNDVPDLMIYSANWPQTRVHHWKSLIIARAIENQCFVLGVNRTGQDENGFAYSGASLIVDFNGNVMCEMDEKDGVLTIPLEMAAMQEYRAKLPFAADKIRAYISL